MQQGYVGGKVLKLVGRGVGKLSTKIAAKVAEKRAAGMLGAGRKDKIVDSAKGAAEKLKESKFRVSKSTKAEHVKPYEVGDFTSLKNKSKVGDGLDINHVPQKHPAGQVIPAYRGWQRSPPKVPSLDV